MPIRSVSPVSYPVWGAEQRAWLGRGGRGSVCQQFTTLQHNRKNSNQNANQAAARAAATEVYQPIEDRTGDYAES